MHIAKYFQVGWASQNKPSVKPIKCTNISMMVSKNSKRNMNNERMLWLNLGELAWKNFY